MMVNSDVVAKARDELGLVLDELAAHLAVSEQVFLETARRLQSVQQRTRRLVDASVSAAAVVSKKDDEDPLARLDEGLGVLQDSVQRGKAALGTWTDGLVRVAKAIDQITPFASEFNRITVTLWALATRTQIENASNGLSGGAFDAVVTDVRHLGGLIRPKFDAVLARGGHLRHTASRALDRTRTFLGRDAADLAKKLEATRSGLAAVEAMRASATALSIEAVRTSEELSRNVTSVLTDLQMHDITRQMMEHVQDALATLTTDGPSPTSVDEALAAIAVQCQLQASQLERARETLEGALDNMAAHLVHVADTATTLADQTRHLSEIRDGTSTLQRVSADIRETGQALHDQARHAKETTSAMQSVVVAMKDVGALTNEIQQIGGEVKLIALNAQVMASRAGDTGSPLAVLARAMRELSSDVQGQTARVGGVMNGIAREAAALGSDELDDASQALAADSAVTAMGEVLRGLETQHTALNLHIDVLDHERTALCEEVRKLTDKLGAQAKATRDLHDLVARVETVGADAEDRVSKTAIDGARLRYKDTIAQYTMEHERAIHREVTQLDRPPSKVGPRAARGSSLGSNVELF
jgi:methyl-accepting chemotaxis protein